MENINLNHQLLCLNNVSFGKTTYCVRLGKKLYYIDIQKDACTATLTLYKKTATKRENQSKYDEKSDAHMIFLMPNAIITKQMLQDIEDIEKAQKISRKYKMCKF